MPDQREECHLAQLVLDNFKSYAGTHTIAFDDKFTCVIGPNGSGAEHRCTTEKTI